MTTEELWHHRYGHLNQNDLVLLKKKLIVEGLPVLKHQHIECEACALGKQHREEFPVQTISIVGTRYFMIFVDDKS